MPLQSANRIPCGNRIFSLENRIGMTKTCTTAKMTDTPSPLITIAMVGEVEGANNDEGNTDGGKQ